MSSRLHAPSPSLCVSNALLCSAQGWWPDCRIEVAPSLFLAQLSFCQVEAKLAKVEDNCLPLFQISVEEYCWEWQCCTRNVMSWALLATISCQNSSKWQARSRQGGQGYHSEGYQVLGKQGGEGRL